MASHVPDQLWIYERQGHTVAARCTSDYPNGEIPPVPQLYDTVTRIPLLPNHDAARADARRTVRIPVVEDWLEALEERLA